MRGSFLVLALLAMPLAAGVAQGQAKPKARPRPAADESTCNADQAAAVARARAEGRPVPPGLDKKNCEVAPPPPPPVPVPPPPSAPPTGPHVAKGVVFEDLDGNGVQDPFAGELGLAGWTIELRWNGQLVASATSDADGLYEFDNLGNTGTSSYSMCAQVQSGYVGTRPADGSGCYPVVFNSTIMTWFEGNFGMKLP